MIQKVLVATNNQDKMKEVRLILADFSDVVLSLNDANIDVDIIEDGTTFEENAIIKVKAIRDIIKESKYNLKDLEDAVIIADDSGLEVDYLNKAPGIYSARYGGYDTSYHIKNQMIIDQLEGLSDEKRTARFVCAIAVSLPNGEEFTVRGTIEGIIGHEELGSNGFGYDPIFYLPEYGLTTAQLDSDEKNKISHRGQALKLMKNRLKEQLEYLYNINKR